MKAINRNMGCRDTRREIEEAGQGEPFSLSVDAHLQSCSVCDTFYDEQLKLRQIVSSLGTVAAPGDFDFRLRARLASEKRGAKRVTIGNFSFGQASAFATILVLIGSAVLVFSLRSGSNEVLVADDSKNEAKVTIGQSVNSTSGSALSADNGKVSRPFDNSLTIQSGNDPALNSRGASPRQRPLPRSIPRGSQLASGSERPKTRDMASTPAKVLRPDNLVAAAGHSVFPIEASPEAMKVSLDNGRGTAKTISVPGVSFGSQRVLTQNPSPLLASSRGAW